MPKEKRDKLSKRTAKLTKGLPTKAWICGDSNFKLVNDEIFCNLCQETIDCKNKSDVKKHAMSKSHLLLKGTESEGSESKTDFTTDLTEMLIQCNISWTKIYHPEFTNLFKKYTNQQLPDEPTLRKHYTEKVYNSIIEGVRTEIISGNNKIWISVVETTDDDGSYVCHFVVGKLNGEPTKPKLLCTKYLDTEHTTIYRFALDCLIHLYGSFSEMDKNKKKIACFLTNDTPNMIAAGNELLGFFPNIKHITCVALALNRIEEDISSSFPAVDNLIMNIKIVFTKAPHRIEKYKNLLPDAPLPPDANFIESGAWLNAALFYEKYLDNIKSIVFTFDDEVDEISIGNAQKSASDRNITTDLKFIKDNFSILSKALKRFEATNLTLNEAVSIIKQVKTKLDSMSSLNNLGNYICAKFNNFIKNNSGFHILDNIDVSNTNPVYKYCPIATVNMGPMFSSYINNYVKSRKDLSQEEIEKLFIVHYYNFSKNDDVF